MMNSKKLMMVIAATVLGLGLTGCGRDNYDGAYSGSEIKMPQAQQQGQTGQQQYMPQMPMGGQYRGVTAELRHDGDIVTGTYNAAQQQYGQTIPGQTAGAAETYRFEANARSANKLEGVRLIPMTSMMGAGCVLEGSLEAVENGRRLTGTLQPANMGYQQMNTWCFPTQITLDRAK